MNKCRIVCAIAVIGFALSTTGSLPAQIDKTVSFAKDPKDRVGVDSIEVSADGTRLVAYLNDGIGELAISDVNTGNILIRIPVHIQNRSVREFALSPDNHTLAVGVYDSENYLIALIDIRNGDVGRKIPGRSPIAFSKDGKLVAAVDPKGESVIVVDAASGETKATIKSKSENQIQDMKFSPTEDALAIASEDTADAISVWNPLTGTLIKSSKSLIKPATKLAFTPDGQRLFASHHNFNQLTECDAHSLRPTAIIPTETGCDVIDLSADGKLLAACGNGTFQLWNRESHELITTTRSESISSVAFTKDAKNLLTINGGDSVLYWDWKSLTRTLKPTEVIQSPPSGSVRQAYLPNGKTLIASLGGKLAILNAQTHKERGVITPHDQSRVSYEWFQVIGNGKYVACRPSFDHSLDIWSLQNFQFQTKIPTGDSHEPVAFSPDGKYFAGPMGRSKVGIFNAADGKFLRPLKTDCADVGGYSPDGKIIYGGFKTWDAATGEEMLAASQTDQSPTCMAPDGKSIVGNRSGLSVWSLETGEMSYPFEIQRKEYVPEMTFSSDGKLFLAAGPEKIRVWEYPSARLVTTLVGPKYVIYGLAISPDKKTVAAYSGGDKSLYFWSLPAQ